MHALGGQFGVSQAAVPNSGQHTRFACGFLGVPIVVVVVMFVHVGAIVTGAWPRRAGRLGILQPQVGCPRRISGRVRYWGWRGGRLGILPLHLGCQPKRFSASVYLVIHVPWCTRAQGLSVWLVRCLLDRFRLYDIRLCWSFDHVLLKDRCFPAVFMVLDALGLLVSELTKSCSSHDRF